MSAPRDMRRPLRARFPALSIAAPLVLLAAACGGEASDRDDQDRPVEAAEGLVATLPDGSRVDLDPTSVTCVPSEEDPDETVLRAVVELESAFLSIQAVPTDKPRSFKLPLDAGDYESGFENVEVFFGSLPDLKTSSTEEGSSGTLELVRASCDPVVLELKIDGTLGTQRYESGTVQLEGHIALTDGE